MQGAFADLEALMHSAQDMVRMAKDLNEQLTAANVRATSTGDAVHLEPEEATFIRSSLAQLGLSMDGIPVTSDMSKDEQKYVEQLSIELGKVLLSGIMRERGIIGLDEVWGGWNRARGVALISPELTLKVLPYLPRHSNPPIHTRILTSGLRVLHTPAYTPSAFSTRLINLIFDHGPRTSTEVAAAEGLNVGLVEEMVHESETRGDVCRDDLSCAIGNTGSGAGGIEVRWWTNVFSQYTWDGEMD